MEGLADLEYPVTMISVQERLDYLDGVMAELAYAQLRSEIAMKDLKKQMEAHIAEMQRDREERKADTRAMKKAWGDLANKLGTVAEDIVAPNIPRLAVEEFGFPEVEDLLVRVRRASRRGEKRQTEYDVICAGPGKVIVVEVKSSPKREDIAAVPERLAEFFDFYPEYEGRALIGMFASWSIAEKLLPAISQAGLYGLAMGEETMEIVARPST